MTCRRCSVIGMLAAMLWLAVGALAADQVSSRWTSEWPRTDFSRHSVDLNEIFSGGPPKDGIPAILDPAFIAAYQAEGMHDDEAVMTLELPGESPRAYPLRYLIWHEIINDVIGGVPVAVTWCPLCNSGIIFDRRHAGDTLSFGVSGNLRHSDMIMYDHQTESWWQQALGMSVVGALTGAELRQLPGWIEPWRHFRDRNPHGQVMAAPNYRRDYGRNPYVGYDTSSWPFLFGGDPPPHDIDPLERVVRVADFAVLLSDLREAGVLHHNGVELIWSPGLASPLDAADMAEGHDIGAVRVRDPDSGHDLPHDLMFAFAFDAFYPEGEWVLLDEGVVRDEGGPS
ncbi:MAG: DUF3179 domain-containing protein [Rhodobacteraceae bacterium]|nr:DUF3179 domain-containing protein [Paracoccaceae bacterium]